MKNEKKKKLLKIKKITDKKKYSYTRIYIVKIVLFI